MFLGMNKLFQQHVLMKRKRVRYAPRHPKGPKKDNMQRRHEFAIMCAAPLITLLVTIISEQVALAHHRFHLFLSRAARS